MLDAPELDAEGRHEQFAGAVALFLAALPGRTGGLLILDDVQWLDGSSLAVLRRLAEELADVPLLVVATVRDDEAGRAGGERFEDAVGAAVDVRIPVGPLDDAGTAALISSYLAGPTVGPEVVAELSTRSRGNPFTVLEYLHSLVDAGALRPSWGTWRLDTDLLREIDLPSDVLDLVVARVDGVGEHVRSVLAVAAAIGTVVPTGLLAEVIGADPAAALAEAAEHGLIQPHADGYAFVHDRIREAMLAAVDADRLRALHQRIAVVLDSAGLPGPAAVYAAARHYGAGETGRSPERVFATGWAAGRLALADNAPDTALTFLETAQEAAERAGIEPDSRFRETLGVAYWSTGRIDPARRQLEAGLAQEPDPVRRAALLLQLAHVLRTGWELSRSIACAKQGLAELGVPLPENPVLLGLSTARIMLRWLAVPIHTHGHGDGLLIAGSAGPGGFTQTHRDVAAAIAGQGSAAYDSARLFTRVQQLATTDGLTGAYNRRHFATLATPQMEVAKRNCRPLAAMMVDIDHFKRINDVYGHATGDEVIRAVAQTLREHLREPDVFCRYGGEEFAAVLSEVHGDPLEIGERLRAAVTALSVPAGGDHVRFTVSIGVSELKPDDTLDTLLDRADQALYQAKRSGRDQVRPG
ncbi:diguanylate cyclase [Planomonospora algeriensis]